MSDSKLPEIESNSVADGFDRQRLGEVYAQALLAGRADSDSTEQVLRQLGELVTGAIRRVPRFQLVMTSPRISSAEKLRILELALSERVHPDLLRFLRVVGSKGRLDCLKEIYAAARRQWNESRGVIEVQVTTAMPLEEGVRGRIEAALSKKLGAPVELMPKVVPQVLGGLRVRIGDQVFDGTVANRLAALGREATERAVRSIRGKPATFVS
jgi:F-type H+-transporting ATPase subunit delta